MDGITTAELVEAYSQCRRKAFLLVRGDPQGKPHEYDRAIAERAAIARSKYLVATNAEDLRPDAREGVRAGSREGRELSAGDPRTGGDALLPARVDGSPASPEPYLIVGTSQVVREHRLRLAFAGYVIGVAGQNRPTHGAVVPFNGKTHRVRIASLYPAVESIIDVLREWNRHLPVDPPTLILNRHCPTCPFRQPCLNEAVQQDNLTLLERMTPKIMRKYAQRGIFTVTQLSYAYRPRRRRKRPACAPPVFNVELQALAIRTKKIYLHQPPSIPISPIELFLDIEGVPEDNFDYLIGLDVRQGDQLARHSLWADSADQELGIFRRCLEIAGRYPNAPVFHYGSYEPQAFARLARKYGIKCEWFTKRLMNVNTAIYGKVYFPTRSNRLKDLAGLAGATWSVRDASGLHSIAWRWHWERTHEEKYKELVLAYNRDDCYALRLVTAELQNMSHAIASRADIDFADAPKKNATPVGEEVHHALDRIVNSAHAEYARKHICVRFGRAVDPKTAIRNRTSQRFGWASNKEGLSPRVGKVIRVPRARICPQHRQQTLAPTSATVERSLVDLVFTRTGCRKTLVRYVGIKATCPLCHTDHNPPAIRQLAGRVFGRSFQAWAVYQHVTLRLPYNAISQLSPDMFAEELNGPSILGFVGQVAKDYACTARRLLGTILQSPFVHADETKINITGSSQYVWVLTDGNHVVFHRTETRETTRIKMLLDGYQGVLISDFYGGYDAVPCRQQKCLVHLIRDLNEDLWKNSFNHEYELFVGAVRDLLVPIFADVDQYGLKTRHLRKHRKAFDRFYGTYIERGEVQCELVAKYRKRFTRYHESIFRFLDTDGLPWNNNAAERAIRHFAIQRKISFSFSGRGADAYLPLLGISQTCRFQNKSFLRFLLSGEKYVDAYREHRRR